MKENSIKVFNYLKEHDGEDFTLADIAEELGLGVRSVNGSVVAFQRHVDENKDPQPLAYREEVEIETEDGSTDKVKFIRLTDAGRDFVAE